MGCVPSRYDRFEHDRYIFDDYDDYDDCCYCGPRYGGEVYRDRRYYIPGYGSSRAYHNGYGDYAEQYYTRGAIGYPGYPTSEVLASQTAVIPYRQSQAFMPLQTRRGYIVTDGHNGGYPYMYQRPMV